jgi:hypothetical protein
MNQSSYQVISYGTAQNGKTFALVSMRTPGYAARVTRAVARGEKLDGRAVDGIGETYTPRDSRPVARVYFTAPVAVEAALVEAAPVEAAPVMVEWAPRAFAIVASAVQLSLFGAL